MVADVEKGVTVVEVALTGVAVAGIVAAGRGLPEMGEGTATEFATQRTYGPSQQFSGSNLYQWNQ